MLQRHISVLALLLLFPVLAAAQRPEIVRPPAPPQAVGVAHTVRVIPEACRRLQGQFTGDAARPYALEAVETNPRCMRRAEFAMPGELPAPSAATGWTLSDRIRIPRSECPSQSAVIEVWRQQRPVPERRRITVAEGEASRPLLSYAVDLRIEGECR